MRQRTGYLPDYQYTNLQKRLYDGEGGDVTTLLSKALFGMSDAYLLHCDGQVQVQWERFDDWQDVMTRLSPLALVAAALCTHAKEVALVEPWSLVPDAVKHSALPHMGNPILDDLLAKRGLAELHLHLNGSSEADVIWLDALARPRLTYKSLKKAFGEKIDEQLRQVAFFLSPYRMYRLLQLAGWLRHRLIKHLFGQGELSPRDLAEWCNVNMLLPPGEPPSSREHPMRRHVEPRLWEATPLALEVIFLTRAIHALTYSNEAFGHALHCYLLIQSCFNRLLVQQLEQNGFDQFQRIADNKLRDPLENERYRDRYQQLLEHMPGRACHIEGRFSPKATCKENWLLLKKITEQWTEICPPDATLALVAHFIKKPPKDKFSFCRHLKLRTQVRHLGWCLATIRERLPQFPLCAIDAAANEMHAPPEVFAPVYRFLRSRGWHNFTYHVGEDFVHLASGLRAIYEALEFLQLGFKDRIGHGTAVGLDPKLWRERTGGSIIIRKLEWLDNLIFLYELLSQEPATSEFGPLLKAKAEDAAQELYGGGVCFFNVRKAWRLRALDPFIAFNLQEPSVLPFYQQERAKALQVENGEKEAWQLFMRYHQDMQLRKAGNLLKEVQVDELSDAIYEAAQRAIVKLLKTRRVAVEIMPTSNVRIACYEAYREHHMFRMLGLGDNPLPEHPDMVLASDDPGIFSTSLRNEYAHVFKSLCDLGLSEGEALGRVQCLLDASWAYRFCCPSSGSACPK
ncbi:hypothetical protein [Megalodesulfovibrio paquesii]